MSNVDPSSMPRQAPPPIVASNVRFAKIGDGTQLALAFLFEDNNGTNLLPPVVVTNDLGALTPELAEIFTKIISQIAPPVADEAVPVVVCRGCGTRIFGDLTERGACLACEPA